MMTLTPSRRLFLLGVSALAMAALATPAFATDTVVSAKGQALARFLNSLNVEQLWIAGAHVSWETGIPDGKPENFPGNHTHCSAFVASAAKRLGIYILRPPRHPQILLANAQNEWLGSDEARSQGWQPVASPAEAQANANQGMLVVASYHNHHDDKPGHIAIVRPGTKSQQQIALDGPDVIQAGGTNFTSASLRRGFAGHPAAWERHEVVFYAHTIDASLD